jgi:LysM repeat protein
LLFQLSANDTLAGIAIKYDISVEDLKRSNGLVNDWDLWKKKGQLLYFQNQGV